MWAKHTFYNKLATHRQKPDTRPDIMALFGCSFKTPGCNRAPEAFKAAVQKKGAFKAAAFVAFGDSGEAFVVQEMESTLTDEVARKRVLKQLVSGGTLGCKFPEKLQLLDFRRFDPASPPFFKAEEILVGAGLLQPPTQLATAPSAVAVTLDPFQVLDLLPGASPEAIRNAWKAARMQHHPDKGGDPRRFIECHDAFAILMGAATVPQVTMALTYEASPAALLEQKREAQNAVQVLKQQLEAAEKHLAAVTGTYNRKSGDVAKTSRRAKAQKVVQQFRKSAKFWDVPSLCGWFRPKVGTFPWQGDTTPAEVLEWVRKWDAAYGEDLREGNEDLDPYVRFEAWRPMRSTGCLLKVKVGRDCEDAAEFGIPLEMNAHNLAPHGSPQWKRLQLMGFEAEAAEGPGRWHTNFDVVSIADSRKAFAAKRERDRWALADKRMREHDETAASSQKRPRKSLMDQLEQFESGALEDL